MMAEKVTLDPVLLIMCALYCYFLWNLVLTLILVV